MIDRLSDERLDEIEARNGDGGECVPIDTEACSYYAGRLDETKSDNRALLAELKELRAERECRPIDDAPLDEDLILGWWEHAPDGRLRWKSIIGMAGSGLGGWWHVMATHWMPTPTCPATGEQSDD